MRPTGPEICLPQSFEKLLPIFVVDDAPWDCPGMMDGLCQQLIDFFSELGLCGLLQQSIDQDDQVAKQRHLHASLSLARAAVGRGPRTGLVSRTAP
jgi:hypothetical protein